MSSALPISEDQRDCLQEITNVATGAAAESLASFTHAFVNLPIPCIRCVDSTAFLDSLKQAESYDRLSSVCQPFTFNGLHCYALIVINNQSLNNLAASTKRSIDDIQQTEELLNDLCTTINHTCFERFGEMIENTVEMQSPSVNPLGVSLKKTQMEAITHAPQLLTVEIHYTTEGAPCNCDLLLLFPEETLEQLSGVLDRLI